MADKQLIGIQILRFVAAMLVVVMRTTEAVSVRISGAGGCLSRVFIELPMINVLKQGFFKRPIFSL